jgi:S-formylglutathione hydrolase FrmB
MRQVTYAAILPNKGTGPYPVLLQLHGFGGDHTDWLRRSNLVRHAEPYPLIVLLPAGENSGYLNLDLRLDPSVRHGVQHMEDFLVRDLWEHAARTFQVRPGPWAIGGLSMGGFGAMRLGLKYPDRFASIWAHSGAYYTREEMVGRYPDPADADVFAYADRLVQAEAPPPVVTFDCGTEDELLAQNRRLHAHFAAIGLPHRYVELPGGHSWDFWDQQARLALEQHADVLDARPEAATASSRR